MLQDKTFDCADTGESCDKALEVLVGDRVKVLALMGTVAMIVHPCLVHGWHWADGSCSKPFKSRKGSNTGKVELGLLRFLHPPLFLIVSNNTSKPFSSVISLAMGTPTGMEGSLQYLFML